VAGDWYEISDAERLVKNPAVSVLMLAYNHGAYLAQAIDGVLAQKSDFPYELLIGEDCSTDNTREIAVAYQRAHPDMIRIITADHNAGAMEGLRRMFTTARGSLVAICEGDDYWTVPEKLKRQAEVFAARPDVSLCFHAADVFDEGSQQVMRVIDVGSVARDYTLDEVVVGGGGMMPTVSMMVRATALPPLDDWFLQAPIADYLISLWAASAGVVHSLPERMAVYRVGGAGSWTSRTAGNIERDWRHTVGALAMLEAFPAKAGRPAAQPAVNRMVRKYLRDFAADHGSNAMRRLAGYAAHAEYLTIGDRLILFAFNDPKSLRMRAAWFARSRWWAVRRRLAGRGGGRRKER